MTRPNEFVDQLTRTLARLRAEVSPDDPFYREVTDFLDQWCPIWTACDDPRAAHCREGQR